MHTDNGAHKKHSLTENRYLKAFWDGDEDLAVHGVLPEVPGEDPVHMHTVRHVHFPLGESDHKQIGSLLTT